MRANVQFAWTLRNKQQSTPAAHFAIPGFDAISKRLGKVIRASQVGLAFWRVHSESDEYIDWVD